ncbi:MAG: hypothetical protein ACRDTF_12120 [Pseudonocardiaceae bacterium]
MLAMVTACSFVADGSGSDSLGIDPDVEQAWALGDGMVDQYEYRTAMERFVSCLADSGYQVTAPVLSPIDQLTLLYDIVPEGDPDTWNRNVETCNLRHFSHIELTYVEAREQVMDDSLRSSAASCLSGKGVVLTGGERNVEDFVIAAGGDGATAMDCVLVSARRLFPGLPSVVKIRW